MSTRFYYEQTDYIVQLNLMDDTLDEALSPTKESVGLGNVDNTADNVKPVSGPQATALGLKQDTSAKNSSGGYAGLSGYALALKGTAGTFSSTIGHSNTTVRAYTLPDLGGTFALLSDIPAAYSLPIATSSVLGGFKVGSGLTIDGAGVLAATAYSLPIASSLVLGGFKVGSGLSIDGAGVLTATAGAYTLPTASSSVLGGIKIGSGLTINATTGVVDVTVGGGGTVTSVNGVSPSSGNVSLTSNDIPENTNLYYTATRVLAAVLTGLSVATSTAAVAADSILVAIGKLQAQITAGLANKDASGGYAGLTLYKLNLKNAANTFTNFLTNATTAARTWTMPDKDGTVAMTSDITPPGWALLAVLTPSGAGTVDFLSVFSSLYDNYEIRCIGLKPSSTDSSLLLRVAISGSASSANTYYYSTANSTASAAATYAHQSNGSPVLASGVGMNLDISIRNVNSSAGVKSIATRSAFQDSASPTFIIGDTTAVFTTAGVLTGGQLFWGNGTNSFSVGKVRVYGVINS